MKIADGECKNSPSRQPISQQKIRTTAKQMRMMANQMPLYLNSTRGAKCQKKK
jgi:hypothetical protein